MIQPSGVSTLPKESDKVIGHIHTDDLPQDIILGEFASLIWSGNLATYQKVFPGVLEKYVCKRPNCPGPQQVTDDQIRSSVAEDLQAKLIEQR